MTTQDAGQALAALLKKIGGKKSPEEPPPRDATLQLVVGCLQWQSTRYKAEQALGAILEEMVDVNELRVSQPHEVIEVIGEDYPNVEQRIVRMREALNEVFRREHGIEIQSIANSNKKDQRHYLDTLPGAPPFAVAQVMLLSYGGHAMPVDEKLATLLAREGVLEEEQAPESAEAALCRLLKAGTAVEAHTLLQAWADGMKMPVAAEAAGFAERARLVSEPAASGAADDPPAEPAPKPAKPTKPAKKSAAKKPATKKPSKTTPAKKAAKKAPAAKTTTKKTAKKTTKKTTKKSTTPRASGARTKKK